jgi:hypothetical protein
LAHPRGHDDPVPTLLAAIYPASVLAVISGAV